jgi:hypothetical protein
VALTKCVRLPWAGVPSDVINEPPTDHPLDWIPAVGSVLARLLQEAWVAPLRPGAVADRLERALSYLFVVDWSLHP